MMEHRLRLVTSRSSIPNCQTCGSRPHKLEFRQIVDGWTTILTEWAWRCQSGHHTPAQLPDMTVKTSEMPPEDEPTMGNVTVLPRIFGEG